MCLSYNFHTGTVVGLFPYTKIIIILLLDCCEFQNVSRVTVLVTDISETIHMIVI